MQLTKTLTASIAATAIVGAIGVAYAQTTDNSAAPAGAVPATNAQMQNPTGPVTPSQETLGNGAAPASVSPAPSRPVDTPAFQGERRAQADRN